MGRKNRVVQNRVSGVAGAGVKVLRIKKKGKVGKRQRKARVGTKKSASR